MATYQTQLKGGYGTLYLELTQRSQNIATNSSVVYYRLYIKGRGNYGFWNNYHTGRTKVVLDGSQVHYQTGRDFDIRNGRTQELASGTTTIKHNTEGKKSFSYSAELWSSSATGSLSGNFNLSTIPRTATITLQNSYNRTINEAETGEDIKINISNQASFRYTVKYTINSSTGTIVEGVNAGSHAWTVPSSWLSSHLSASTSALVTLQVETYNGTQLINTQHIRLKITAPSGTRPNISTINVSEDNAKKRNVIGHTPYYQNLSQLRVQVIAFGQDGSTIKNTQIRLAGQTLSGSDVTFNPVSDSGNQSIQVTVTDSRGRTATKSQTVYLNSYNLPNIAIFNAYRSDLNSRIGYAKLNVSNTVMGSNNPLSVIVERSEKGSNSWSRAYSSTVGNGSLNTTISVGSTFDNFKAYDIRLKISDRFNSHTAVVTLGASSQSLVIGASDPVVGIGKTPTLTKGLDVAGEIVTDNKLTVNNSSGDFVQFKRNGSTVGRLSVSGSNLTFNGSTLSTGTQTQTPALTSGNNSNGRWMKFEDGTLICASKVSGVPYGKNKTHVFPHVFKDEPFVTATARRPGGYRNLTIMIQSIENKQVILSAGNDNVTGIDAEVIAIGRWK